MLLCWGAYACGGHIFWHLMAACLQRGHQLTLDGICMPPGHGCPSWKAFALIWLICPPHVYASHKAAASRGSAYSLTRMPRRLEVSQTSYHLIVLLQLSWRFQSLVNFIVALGILWCSVIFIHGIYIWQLKIMFVPFNSYIVKCCHWVVLQRHWQYFPLHFLRILYVLSLHLSMQWPEIEM